MAISPRPTEAALLGCSHPHSGAHLPTLMTLPEVTGIHLWDPEPGAAEQLAPQAGDQLRAVHRDLDAILADDRIGWILACTRTDLSPAVLLQCAAAGKPVFTEKPIGRSYAEVAPIVAAFKARGLSLAVAFCNRYKPAARQIREWLDRGWLGRLTVAETRLHTTSVALRDPQHWLFSQAASGSGILGWLGCHYLDLLRWLMRSEVVSVAAHCATASGEAIDVEDLACLTLRFGNGVLATASFGYLMPGGRSGYLFPGYDSYFGFKGTAGQITWPPQGKPQRLEVYSLHEDWVGAPGRVLSFDEEDARAYGARYGLEFARACLHAAQTGEPAPADGDDMLAVWRIIEAALRSSDEGVHVAV